jgi:hypothetical protein
MQERWENHSVKAEGVWYSSESCEGHNDFLLFVLLFCVFFFFFSGSEAGALKGNEAQGWNDDAGFEGLVALTEPRGISVNKAVESRRSDATQRIASLTTERQSLHQTQGNHESLAKIPGSEDATRKAKAKLTRNC